MGIVTVTRWLHDFPFSLFSFHFISFGREMTSDYDDDNDDDIFDELEKESEKDGFFDKYRQEKINQLNSIIRRNNNLSNYYSEVSTNDELIELMSKKIKFGNQLLIFINENFISCQLLVNLIKEIILKSNGLFNVIIVNALTVSFIVDKLKIKTLPSLVFYNNGQQINIKVGLNGLLDDPSDIKSLSEYKLNDYISKVFSLNKRDYDSDNDYSD